MAAKTVTIPSVSVKVAVVYNVYEYRVLAGADATHVSPTLRRLATMRRSLVVFASFATAMLLAFMNPLLGFRAASTPSFVRHPHRVWGGICERRSDDNRHS